jgi:ABC-type xylose transport system permease subunit
VGGVSEGAGAKAGGSHLSATKIPSRVVTVKGILVFRKARLFAGRRRNEGLGRSARLTGYLPGEAARR